MRMTCPAHTVDECIRHRERWQNSDAASCQMTLDTCYYSYYSFTLRGNWWLEWQLWDVRVNWCRCCSQHRISRRMSGLTGTVTSTCRTIVDDFTTLLTVDAKETGWSFSTWGARWLRRTWNSLTFQLYNRWQMHFRNCPWWQTFFCLLSFHS